MIRVTLANGSSELLEREIAPRRPDETLYDFTLRSAREMTLETRALRALLDGHMANLAAERSATRRQQRLMLVGQSVIGALIATLLIRPDTIGDACIIALPAAVLTTGSSLLFLRAVPGLDLGLVRACRWWRQ